MSDETLTINLRGLEQLLKALKAKPPVARVGILGDKTTRRPPEGKSAPAKGALSNAEIGALYEFNDGSSDRPGGSFLRIPISEELDRAMEKSGALDEKAMKDVIAEGSVLPWLRKVAIIAESIVQDAFNTAGFGKWKPSNMDHKKNHQTLVETKQLRESITSEVRE